MLGKHERIWLSFVLDHRRHLACTLNAFLPLTSGSSNRMAKILLVDDDIDLCNSISERLKSEQHTVESISNGVEAEQRLRVYDYDCVILDWNLPGMEGLAVCRNFRKRGGRTPILLLTGRTALEEKELGLDSGADDYLTKPFSVRELAARVRALLRRPPRPALKIINAGRITLNISDHEVKLDGELIHLRPKEFSILELLMKNKQHTFSTDALLEKIWSNDPDATADSVRIAITRLRQKIDLAGQASVIVTVHGRGYKIVE